MAKISYTALRNADLAKLTRAADDWEEAATDLSRLAKDAQHGMVAKSESAAWAGVNADVTRPFVRKIANEVEDLHQEAKTVAHLLQGARDELTEIQDKLDAEHRTANNREITIVDMTDGTVYCAFADDGRDDGALLPRPDDGVTAPKYKGSADHTPEEQAGKDRIEKTVNTLLARAARLDHDVSTFLAQARGKSPYDAGHKTYRSLEQAEGQRAASLAEESIKQQERGEELTPTQLNDLNSALKTYGRDPEFATTFYRKLGAEDALRFQAQLSLDASAGEGTSTKTAHSIQKHMGTALAAATRTPDDPTDARSGDRTHLGTRWVDQLTKAGRRELDLDPAAPPAAKDNPRGYQILGNILRHGKYETEFLNKVGKDMVEFERERGGGDSNRGPWGRPEMQNADQRLYLGKNGEAGYDPVTGLMEALGHSPEAANDFFNDSTGGGQTGVERKSNFAYFLGDENGEGARKWDSDTANMMDPRNGDNEGKVFGEKSLGHALEAATTGTPHGYEGPPKPHTAAEAALTHKVVAHFGSPGLEQATKPGGELSHLSTAFGNIAAEYMPDIQRAMDASSEKEVSSFGANPNLGEFRDHRLESFIARGGQSPEGYASITHAQSAVSVDLIREAMANPDKDESLAEAAYRGAERGKEVSELATEGRTDAVRAADDTVEKVEKFNESVDLGSKWSQRIIDMGVSKIPGGGDAAGWLMEDLNEAVSDSIKQDPEAAKELADRNADDYAYNETKERATRTKDLIEIAGKELGRDPEEVRHAASKAYLNIMNPVRGEN